MDTDNSFCYVFLKSIHISLKRTHYITSMQ